MNDTGKTTSAIYSRADDEAWPAVKAALEDGATLWRPPKLRAYYVDRGNGDVGRGSLTPARVAKLEGDGVLEWVGENRYRLASRVRACEGEEDRA